jgi:hypothetical protein
MRTAAPRDRLYELRTKVEQDTAEALRAWAEEWEVSEYEAYRRIVYFGLAALAALHANTPLAIKTAHAVAKGTPSAEDPVCRGFDLDKAKEERGAELQCTKKPVTATVRGKDKVLI